MTGSLLHPGSRVDEDTTTEGGGGAAPRRGGPEAPADAAFPGESPPTLGRPRLGFLGVGWIGLDRMKAVAAADVADVVAVADPSAECRARAAEAAPSAEPVRELDELLELDLDGIVIATPSALHAAQAERALRAGLAVFCQKPLGRTEAEVRRVVEAAGAAGRPLGVDMCYRTTAAMRAIRPLIADGALGRVFAADLVFHNAYGPDKAWFYDPALSGGGCVMDLGIHLVDLALWALGGGEPETVRARLVAGGEPWTGDGVEDFALATLELPGGAVVRIACSWNLHAGREAVIEAAFHGTEGGAALKNVEGSFYDFVAERWRDTGTERLVEPPDAWGGRPAVEWAGRVARGEGFDAAAGEELVRLARTLDRIYGRGS